MLSAFGKAIILGEHAVVHGRPALAVGLPEGLVLESCVARPGPSRIRVTGTEIDEAGGSAAPLGAALRLADEQAGGNGGGCDLVIRANIPFGAGLGSSAALSVLVVRATAIAKGVALSDREVRARAHEIEKCFHGNPSGIDDTVATFGGLCVFRRGGWDGVPPIPGAVKVTQQALRLPCDPPPLVVGDSGVQRNTRDVVAAVGRRLETDRVKTEEAFDRIAALVGDGVRALRQRDMARLAGAMNGNQTMLHGLGVSCLAIDSMIGLALDAGALAAKLTGAGGGGCVIALAPGDEDRVLDAWRSAGFRAWKAFNRPAEKKP